MPGTILVVVEHEQGVPRRVSIESAAKAGELAAELGGDAVAVALGTGASAACEALQGTPLGTVYVDDRDLYDRHPVQPHVDAVASLIKDITPAAVLLPATVEGRDIAARLSARLGTGLVANVVGLEVRGDRIAARESVFGGTYTTTVAAEGPTPLFLIRPNAFSQASGSGSAECRSMEFAVSDGALQVEQGEAQTSDAAEVPLEEATAIVAGGRGLGGPEPFTALGELAQALGASLGASRAAVDAGWIDYSHQIGQTGRTVQPQLYIAVGISGAVQHRVGMQTADVVVAINKDADAPIFQMSDFGVVGDLFEVVPALTREIKRRKGGVA